VLYALKVNDARAVRTDKDYKNELMFISIILPSTGIKVLEYLGVVTVEL
jgi:hypothetical protein